MTRFYYVTNGNSFSEFRAEFRTPKEQIARLLGLLGDDRTSLAFEPIPDAADFLTFIHESRATTFLQCAGTSDAMTIEWRRLDDDGEERLYVVGRGGDHSGPPTVTIRISDNASTTVYPDEVFTAAEATDIFYAYYETQLVPDPYQLREYDLTYPKPGP